MGTKLEQSAESTAADAERPKRTYCRVVWRTVRLLLIAYLSVMVLLMIFEDFFIYFPSRYPEGQWQPSKISPEDAQFQADDGTRLHGWFAAHPEPRAVVLFCHGNAGNITHRAETLRILNELVGVSVLMFDYRGYGKSEGKPNEEGILADARAARAWLAERAGVAEGDVVLMGRSLGGAVVVDLAANDSARALVLESTFSSLPDLAAYHYPWLPVRTFVRTQLNSAEKISDYHGPLLQSHGSGDTIVPFEYGCRLFEAANQPKQFHTVEGRGHNEPQDVAYFERLIAFLDGLD